MEILKRNNQILEAKIKDNELNLDNKNEEIV